MSGSLVWGRRLNMVPWQLQSKTVLVPGICAGRRCRRPGAARSQGLPPWVSEFQRQISTVDRKRKPYWKEKQPMDSCCCTIHPFFIREWGVLLVPDGMPDGLKTINEYESGSSPLINSLPLSFSVSARREERPELNKPPINQYTP